MSQSKRHSGIESTAKVIMGAVSSWSYTMIIVPLILAVQPNPHEAALITLGYMPLSWVINYLIRRVGNALQQRSLIPMATVGLFSRSSATGVWNGFRGVKKSSSRWQRMRSRSRR